MKGVIIISENILKGAIIILVLCGVLVFFMIEQKTDPQGSITSNEIEIQYDEKGIIKPESAEKDHQRNSR